MCDIVSSNAGVTYPKSILSTASMTRSSFFNPYNNMSSFANSLCPAFLPSSSHLSLPAAEASSRAKMACFTNLSNELYFEILQYLPPPDLGSFFCINKHLYALTAIQRERHNNLKRRFSTSLNTKQPGSTAKLIESILVDPQIALYVQHFTIDGCDFRYRNPWEDQNEFTDSDMALLQTALRDLDYLSVNEVQKWISDIYRAPEEYLINLALTLLPNLTSIDILHSVVQSDPFYRREPFYRLGRLLMNTVRQYTDTNNSGVPFAKLISITISALDDCVGDIELIEAFATLPSVRIINAKKVVSSTKSLEAIVPAKSSNVSDLNIWNASLSPHRLTIHLRRFERLQSFTYWPTSDPQPRYNFDPFMIITALLASTQNSLRELHIRSGSATPEYMGSLREFRVLECLETDTDLLFGPSPVSHQNFSTSLPSSIKDIKLHGWSSTYGKLQALLIHLISARNDLASLGRIEFFESTLCKPPPDILRVMCATVKITLVIRDSEHVSLPIYTRHRAHYAERRAKKALTQGESI